MTENNDVLDDIANNPNLEDDPDKIMTKIDREMTRIKFKSFGKVKYRDKNDKKSENLKKLQKQKLMCNNEDDMAALDIKLVKELEKVRRENMKVEMEKFKEYRSKKGHTAAIFNLKETLVGGKKKVQGEL